MSDAQQQKPLWAAILSAIVPGLGQFVFGDRRKSFLIWLALLGLPVLGSALGLYETFAGLVLSLILLVGVYVPNVLDAYRSAGHRESAAGRFKPSYVCVLLPLLVVNAYGMTTAQGREKIFGAGGYTIAAQSMSETLQHGDRVMADFRHYSRTAPHRGDIVVFEDAESGQVWVKRVVAIEYDVLEIRDHRVVLNGQPLDEAYTRLTDEDSAHSDMASTTVPPHQVFLLGDNRGGSKDSRHFGPVSLAQIKAKASYIYWSPDRARIGRHLD